MKNAWRNSMLFFLASIFISANLMAQNAATIKVNGIVKDNLGPIIGATVAVEGTTIGTTTDIDGKFSLQVPAESILTVSFIGYHSLKIAASDKEIIVMLEENAKLLDEIIVIGYGSVKKEDVTGSVTSIKIDEQNKGQVTTAQDLLAGKIAGVSVVSSGGRPGDGAQIRIRGGSSLNATNDPLVIVDGVIMSNDLPGSSNYLSMVNPNDIESFTVLKDASATAIYGSRASNGVIMIATKKGTSGKPKISYNGTFSLSMRRNSVDVMDGDEYREFIKNKYKYTANKDDVLSKLGTHNTDWQKEIFQTAFGTDHNLSVYGTTMNTPYRASVGYTSEEGILMTSKLERLTANLSLTPSFFDNHLKLNINAKGMYSKTRFAEAGAVGAALAFDPTQSVYDENSITGGYFSYMNGGEIEPLAPKNPVATLSMRDNTAQVRNFIGNIQADYKLHFFPDIKVNLNLGLDIAKTKGTDYKNPFNPDGYRSDDTRSGSRKRFENFRNNQLFEIYAQYVKDVESIKSRFDVMGGYSWQRYKKTNDEYTHYVSKDDFSDLNRTDDTDHYRFKEYYLISQFGRINYTFDNKYLLTFTLRNDGSSRFASGNRWGLFPAAAFAWRINEESFIKDFTALSDLKLRLGWGQTGQQDLGDDYMYPAKASYILGGDYGYYPMGLNPDGSINWIKQMKPKAYNPNLKWETTTTWNAGIDYGFLNNRINGAIDLYYRKTKDLLNKESDLIAGIGFAEQLPRNIGSLENKGIEFSINAVAVKSKDLEWNLGFNIAYNNSKITQLNEIETEGSIGLGVGDTGGDGKETLQRYVVDHAPRTFYVFEQVYDSNGNPLEGVYVDRDGDGTITDADKYFYKKPAADVLLGFNSKLTYKNWDFGFNARASLGNYVYDAVAANRADLANNAVYRNEVLSNRPFSAFDTNFQSKQLLSDYYVKNASFLKIDNITLGYSFSDILKTKLRARAYFTVQNPIVITSYNGLDPEVVDGIDFDIYPRPLSFLFGFNLNF